jgi:hypothetical protein
MCVNVTLHFLTYGTDSGGHCSVLGDTAHGRWNAPLRASERYSSQNIVPGMSALEEHGITPSGQTL